MLLRADPDSLRLVAVTDEPDPDLSAWIERVASAVRGGATSVQVRAKHAASRTVLDAVRQLVAILPVPVLVNDRADIAIMAGAAGVHLGSDDIPVATVRALAPAPFIIGASVGSRAELDAAGGADYVGIGPAFLSASKTDAGSPLLLGEIEELARQARLAGVPAIAIGGIDATNVRSVLDACPALAGVAVVSALFGARDVGRAAAALRGAIGR